MAWTHSVSYIITPTWQHPVGLLMKMAFDPALQVYIAPGSLSVLQGYLQEIIAISDPEREDSRSRQWIRNIQAASTTQDVLNHPPAGKRLILANSVYDVLMNLSSYFHPMGPQQTDIRRIQRELEAAVQQRQEQASAAAEQTLAKRRKVDSFRIIEATPDYTSYGISWTSHLPNYPKAFKSETNPIRQQIQEELSPKGVRVVSDSAFVNELLMVNLKAEDIPVLKSIFERNGFNTAAIDALQLTEVQTPGGRRTTGRSILFENATLNSDYHLFIPSSNFEQRTDLKPVIDDLVNFAFPISGTKPGSPQEEARTRGRRDIAAKREEMIAPAGTHYTTKRGIYLKGSYNNYRDLQTLLKTKQIDSNIIDLVLKVGSELRATGHVKVTEILNGVLDKYYKTRAARHRLKDPNTGLYLPDEEAFNNEAMGYEVHKPNEEPYRLRPLQVDGVRWLYSRQSAILGDEPGVGKTEQMIVAANMRTKDENLWDKRLATGRVLVFTPASVVEQFGLRILYTVGASPEEIQQFQQRGFCDSIATDVNQIQNTTKWLVMSYDKISGRHAEERMQTIRNLNFDVMVLDECHLVKNPTSSRSQNVIKLGKNIPFKWGASATVSANTPDDLHNQLLAVGHPLGHLGRSKFINQYTGAKTIQLRGQELRVDPASTRDFLKNVVRKLRPDFDALSLDEKFNVALRIAEEEPINELQSLKDVVFDRMKRFTNLKASLVLTDVYRKRTKKEVNENIPPLLRQVERVEATPQQQMEIEKETERIYTNMREHNKDAEEPLVRLTARRMAIAEAKIPQTLEKAFSVLSSAKKVLIFSCFRQTAESIAAQLQELVAPNYQVGLALGGDTHKEQKIRDFMNPNGNTFALVLTILSSGTGVDIPNTTQDVIINDISWTPKDADQVEGRAHRVNSQSPVTNHYMVLGGTQDEVIFNLVQKKRHIAESIQSADKAYVERVRNNQSVKTELKEAQELQWQKVIEELRSRIAMEHWAQQQQQGIAARNWLGRTKLG